MASYPRTGVQTRVWAAPWGTYPVRDRASSNSGTHFSLNTNPVSSASDGIM